MRTFILFFLIITLNAAKLFSQTVEYPFVKNSEDPSTLIAKIERNSKYTIVTFEHSQSGPGWIALDKGIYLQNADGSEVYHFIKAEGIPLSPAKKELKGTEGKFTFKVYFEKVPSSVKTINIVERAVSRRDPGSYFNYFGVSLDKNGGGLKGGSYQQVQYFYR